MGILMDGGNAVELGWEDHPCSLPTKRLPDMDSFQIEDILEVDPGRPCRRLADADCAVWIDS